MQAVVRETDAGWAQSWCQAGNRMVWEMGFAKEKGYFWQKWVDLPTRPIRSWDEWKVTLEVGDNRDCMGSRALGLSTIGAGLCLITWH